MKCGKYCAIIAISRHEKNKTKQAQKRRRNLASVLPQVGRVKNKFTHFGIKLDTFFSYPNSCGTSLLFSFDYSELTSSVHPA